MLTTTTTALLTSLEHPRYRLRSPIVVQVRERGDEVSVWSAELEVLCIGPDKPTAFADFRRAVACAADSLWAGDEHSGRRRVEPLARLRELLERVDG